MIVSGLAAKCKMLNYKCKIVVFANANDFKKNNFDYKKYMCFCVQFLILNS